MKYLLSILVVSLCACSHIVNKDQKAIANVFIHGSHFDGEVWTPLLEDFAGYDNIAITLKGRTDTENVSLTEMAHDVCNKISKPSRLIVHSFAGAVANQMVGICPNKIDRIIYIAAIVPIKGEQAFDLIQGADQETYSKAVQFNKYRIKPHDMSIFLKVMDAEITAKNMPLFKIYSESYKPGEDAISYDSKKFDAIPKYYIYTSKDKIISPATQDKYVKRTMMVQTASVPSGHLPMLSTPSELVAAIRSFL